MSVERGQSVEVHPGKEAVVDVDPSLTFECVDECTRCCHHGVLLYEPDFLQLTDCASLAEAATQVRGEDFVSTSEQSGDELIETEEDANFEGKPTAKHVTCDECGHGTAWYTIKQTGAADEPPTRFFNCQDCGNRWREYS